LGRRLGLRRPFGFPLDYARRFVIAGIYNFQIEWRLYPHLAASELAERHAGVADGSVDVAIG
jgi:hypothetical protein